MANYADQIADLIRQGRKIEAIKLLRETTGVGLKEAKDEIDRLSAGLPPAPTSQRLLQSDTAPSPDVLALARAGNKIAAIKLLREQTGLGLKEAKERVESIEGVPKGGGCAGSVALLLGLVLLAAGLLFLFLLSP